MIDWEIEPDWTQCLLEEWAADNKEEQAGFAIRVWMHHFSAMRKCIEMKHNTLEIKALTQKLQTNRCIDLPLKRISELLYNSWNTEIFLNKLVEHTSKEVLTHGLPWLFPKLYYSAYHNMNAFALAKGTLCKTHDGLLRNFATHVKNGVYPEGISMHALGTYQKYEYYPKYHQLLPIKRAHEPLITKEDVFAQICSLLKSTRDEKHRALKRERQSRTKTAILSKKNTPLKSFKSDHWQQISDKMGPTTLFDFLYRMRIKANYHGIDGLIDPYIDVQFFYKECLFILSYFNEIHETFLRSTLGAKNFEMILNSPLVPEIIKERYYNRVLEYC